MKYAVCAVLLIFALDASAEVVGDAEAGQNKAAVCAACHGVDGNSINAEWPKLAGQHAKYLERQTMLFKNGGRVQAVMSGMAMPLSEQDMADISAFYAQQTPSQGVADEALVALGEAVYRGGKADAEVPACMACHGPSGAGNPGVAYPQVRGQHADYSAAKLRAFRDGEIWGKGEQANSVMVDVARGLTDEEIEALASYMEGLH
ncbi:MAG: cytochrome c [Lysobacteraceae bacterium]|nr:MAG: cytochrome c [Xanthomonadaceae bacterium]